MKDNRNEDKIFNYLRDNKCSVNGVYEDHEGGISVVIRRGDWKHDHLYCDKLMKDIGYIKDDEVITDDDDESDSYSAVHYFKREEEL